LNSVSEKDSILLQLSQILRLTKATPFPSAIGQAVNRRKGEV